MTKRPTSGTGWRTTLVDTLALSFVFLILLVRPPVPDHAAAKLPPAADRSRPGPDIGMLTSSLRQAVREDRLSGGTVTSSGRRAVVTLPLRWLDDGQIVARARTVARRAASLGGAVEEIVLRLPGRPDDGVYRSLSTMARALPASWMVQVADGRPQLRMAVSIVDG